jgi:hypothetical protein
MGRRIRWARAAIAAGSLVVVQAIIILAHAFLHTNTAGRISLWIGLAWVVLLAVVWSAWSPRPDGGRRLALPIITGLLGAMASVMVAGNAPDALLARVGRPTPATVVAESTDPLGGSGAHHYIVQDAGGRRIPGELRDSFDSYDAGSRVLVLADPRGRIAPEDIPLAASTRWLQATNAFSLVAIILTVAALVLCLITGYLAPGTSRGK